MPAPFHRILSKCDRAFVAYLVACEVGGPGQVVPAKRSGNKDLPLVIAYSESYTTIRNTGCYTVQMALQVKTPASVEVGAGEADPPADSDELVAEVIDALYTIADGSAWDSKKMAAQITVAARTLAATDPNYADLADFTILDVRHTGGEAGIVEGDLAAWTETVRLEIDCAPSDVD
jgi:hypothetical protein